MNSVNNAEILGKIKHIIGNIAGLDPQRIGDKDSLRDDLKLDSLSLLEIGVDVDLAFKLNLPDERYKEIQTLPQMAALVEERLGELASLQVGAV